MAGESVQDDIAYMAKMTRAGAEAPLSGGRFAVWWGGLAALTLLAHWAILTGRLPVAPDWLWALWLGFIGLGSAGQIVLIMSVRGKPGEGSAVNRASASVWPAMGLSLFLFWVGLSAGVLLGRLEPVVLNMMLPLALLGYAIGWLTNAFMARSVRLALPGLAALTGMLISLPFVFTAEIYLLAAATVFVAGVLPGLFLMRGEAAKAG